MAVVIEELEVQTQPSQEAPAAPTTEVAGANTALMEATLQTVLQREAWRLERLAAD